MIYEIRFYNTDFAGWVGGEFTNKKRAILFIQTRLLPLKYNASLYKKPSKRANRILIEEYKAN